MSLNSRDCDDRPYGRRVDDHAAAVVRPAVEVRSLRAHGRSRLRREPCRCGGEPRVEGARGRPAPPRMGGHRASAPLAALVAFGLDRAEHVPGEQRGRLGSAQLLIVAGAARYRAGPEASGGVGARSGGGGHRSPREARGARVRQRNTEPVAIPSSHPRSAANTTTHTSDAVPEPRTQWIGTRLVLDTARATTQTSRPTAIMADRCRRPRRALRRRRPPRVSTGARGSGAPVARGAPTRWASVVGDPDMLPSICRASAGVTPRTTAGVARDPRTVLPV